jgi:anti-sigma regulatory factor (Ser/Thr protein kinase)
MPLSRPALALTPGPRSVQEARRWVGGTVRDIDRDDLVECAELGVSELVTNALLHADAPITVQVRGTREHPRVEVRDGSAQPPVLPEPQLVRDDDVLMTFGRGLSIVARASDAWGVDLEERGKTVWFAPASAFSEEMSVAARVTGVAPPEPTAADGEQRRYSIRGVPVSLYVDAARHFAELRREIRLLALAHQDDYPLAKNLSDVFATFDHPRGSDPAHRQVEAALASGRTTVDLEVSVPESIVERVDVFRQMLDLADDFCRSERLLALARSSEQRAFQDWFLGELVRQGEGRTPTPWRPDRSEVPESSAS